MEQTFPVLSKDLTEPVDGCGGKKELKEVVITKGRGRSYSILRKFHKSFTPYDSNNKYKELLYDGYKFDKDYGYRKIRNVRELLSEFNNRFWIADNLGNHYYITDNTKVTLVGFNIEDLLG
jgi:hypothetical protein